VHHCKRQGYFPLMTSQITNLFGWLGGSRVLACTLLYTLLRLLYRLFGCLRRSRLGGVAGLLALLTALRIQTISTSQTRNPHAKCAWYQPEFSGATVQTFLVAFTVLFGAITACFLLCFLPFVGRVAFATTGDDVVLLGAWKVANSRNSAATIA
jgi:hypothetical protein